jgi:multiple sugar transport system substrate-binding protein
MRSRTAVLAAMLVMAPLCARGADLVVWWETGIDVQEDEAVREIIATFEQGSGKHVDLSFDSMEEFPKRIEAALAAGQPPDFAFGYSLSTYVPQWARDDRLVDLTDTVGHFSDVFDPYQLERATLLNARAGQKALYGLPMGQVSNYLHAWKSLLEQAGFTLADIPKEWEAFWAFWCDDVQPAARRATGRDNIWGVGLAMSPDTPDTADQFLQFLHAYGADYVTRDGRLVIDDPEIRRRLIEAINSYTAIYRKGCTPPDAVRWSRVDNNKQFLAQTIVMTPNSSLSIPIALKRERPDDYKNAATLDWPLGPSGEAFPIEADANSAVVFRDGANVATAKEFVRFLVDEGWLMHYLNFSGERMLPSIPALLDQPFWLDPSDPHRMAAVMQAQARPLSHQYAPASGDLRHNQVYNEWVWPKAINRIVMENITPEQAVDEAIARIKQILSE